MSSFRAAPIYSGRALVFSLDVAIHSAPGVGKLTWRGHQSERSAPSGGDGAGQTAEPETNDTLLRSVRRQRRFLFARALRFIRWRESAQLTLYMKRGYADYRSATQFMPRRDELVHLLFSSARLRPPERQLFTTWLWLSAQVRAHHPISAFCRAVAAGGSGVGSYF